jgi:hypothetical protein
MEAIGAVGQDRVESGKLGSTVRFVRFQTFINLQVDSMLG